MPASNEIQIGLVTDTHFWFGSDQCFGEGGRQLQPQSQLLLDSLVTDLQAQHLDLILHLGDVTCGGGGFDMPDPQVATAIQKVKAGLEKIGCPLGMLPGNHDCRLGHSFDETDRLLNLDPGFGTSFTFPAANLHIELIHSHTHTEAERAESLQKNEAPVHGRVAPIELDRLQHSLEDAAGFNVLAGSHQLLLPMSPWREPAGPKMHVANSPEVVQLLARHGQVQAVFQGHTHAYDLHQIPLGSGICTAVVVPALIMWPFSWLLLTATSQSLTWELKPLPIPVELQAQSRDQVKGDQPPGRPTWNPWRVDFPQ